MISNAGDSTPYEHAACGDDLIVHLERAIQTRTGGRVHGLHVMNRAGVVSVRGQVHSFYSKQLVLAAAMDHLAGKDIEVRFDVEVK